MAILLSSVEARAASGISTFSSPRTPAVVRSAPLNRNVVCQAKRPDVGAKAAAVEAPTEVMLKKNIKTPDPVPQAGIDAANVLMGNGRMYRYNSDSAETCAVSEVEAALAKYMNFKYCVALNSCGSALFLSLKVAGCKPGDKVLSNAFTFLAVPSAIEHAGGVPVYVDCNEGLVLDMDDLREKAISSGAKFLMVSHMRGKLSDMDAVAALCEELGITMLEDCAHSLGVTWNGVHSGHHGVVACVSSQSYKMLNSGEGGFLLTDDDEMAAKAMVYAGAYEKLYHKHLLCPPAEVLERVRKGIPNYSLRMSSLTASIITPQIASLDERIAIYNSRYEKVEARLNALENATVPKQYEQVGIVADSVQFHLTGFTQSKIEAFTGECARRGLLVEVFGAIENARYFRNWEFCDIPEDCKKTEEIIRVAMDMRLPLMFEDSDIEDMCVILEEAHDLASAM